MIFIFSVLSIFITLNKTLIINANITDKIILAMQDDEKTWITSLNSLPCEKLNMEKINEKTISPGNVEYIYRKNIDLPW